jgi:hypothetical protein
VDFGEREFQGVSAEFEHRLFSLFTLGWWLPLSVSNFTNDTNNGVVR